MVASRVLAFGPTIPATSSSEHVLNVIIFSILNIVTRDASSSPSLSPPTLPRAHGKIEGTISASPARLVMSLAEHWLNVIITFSIFNIVSRDVTHYAQRAGLSSHSFPPPAPARAHGRIEGTHLCTARAIMRWLTALLCFTSF